MIEKQDNKQGQISYWSADVQHFISDLFCQIADKLIQMFMFVSLSISTNNTVWLVTLHI